jgi:hypothetical protein
MTPRTPSKRKDVKMNEECFTTIKGHDGEFRSKLSPKPASSETQIAPFANPAAFTGIKRLSKRYAWTKT